MITEYPCKITYKGNIIRKLPNHLPKYLDDDGNTVQETVFLMRDLPLTTAIQARAEMIEWMIDDAKTMGTVLGFHTPPLSPNL